MLSLFAITSFAQKKGLESINRPDLEMHMEFLASDELEGRATGEPGLDIAARYLAAQVKHLGLISADPENGFYQYYAITEKAYDREKCQISILPKGKDAIINKESFYIFPGAPDNVTSIEGEVVFAGYGINDEAHDYNDLEGLDLSGKIVMIMDRAPMNEDGTEAQFDNEKWNSMQNFQYKMRNIMGQGPKAVLLVFDPKCGFNSLGEKLPQVVNFLESSKSLKSDEEDSQSMQGGPQMLIIHREVADLLLETSGKNLADIQNEIDKTLTPNSFLLPDVNLKIDAVMKETEYMVPNVFGMIEGSDPVLKEEVVLYMAHFDHLGTDGQGGVFNGSDDNASGSVALIEIAEAFLKEKKQPKRSVGFLWVSGEEIGLFGSSYFADHPMVPVENIAAAINLDMVARAQSEEDRQSDRDDLTIEGGDTIEVIGGIQSKVLLDLNAQSLKEVGLIGNYTYNDLDHPSQFFYRSDHISFARKDIPVIFYSTGTHVDYHELTDTEDKTDYDRFIEMTQLGFMLGYKTANYKEAIEVDNPMSGWDR